VEPPLLLGVNRRIIGASSSRRKRGGAQACSSSRLHGCEVVCAFAGLYYAGAFVYPRCPDRLTHSYTTLGEFVAWIMGFPFCSNAGHSRLGEVAAVGWSSYVVGSHLSRISAWSYRLNLPGPTESTR